MLMTWRLSATPWILRSLDAVCSVVGLSISSKKSKILAICPSISHGAPPRDIHLNSEEEPVAVVEEFVYLASTITHDQDCILGREISVSITKAARTFGSLYRMLWPEEAEDFHQNVRVQECGSLHSVVWLRYLGPTCRPHE